jgi:hypothetical protein
MLLYSLSHKHASRPLNVQPTEKELRMNQTEIQQLCRLRLGLPPSDLLRDSHCCCAKQSLFSVDPAHFHLCTQLRGTAITSRHNALVKLVGKLATSIQCTVEYEPKSHLQSEQEESKALKDNPKQCLDRRHGDLLISAVGHLGYVDVTVTHPASDAKSRHATATAIRTPLNAASASERRKMNRYADLAHRNGYDLIPFALETFGAFGKKAEAYIKLLSKRSDDPKQFIENAFNQLSVLLQKGNSAVSVSGMHQMQNNQLRRALVKRANRAVRSTSASVSASASASAAVATVNQNDADADADADVSLGSDSDSDSDSDIDIEVRLPHNTSAAATYASHLKIEVDLDLDLNRSKAIADQLESAGFSSNCSRHVSSASAASIPMRITANADAA